jgi:hypothetical protein
MAKAKTAVFKLKVFISHISEERELGGILKKHLEDSFLGTVEVFMTSDLEAIPPGAPWLHHIGQALNQSRIVVVLCSKESIAKPWINFEAGAGWIKGINVVPVCHSGLRPSDLPEPLHFFHSIRASDIQGLRSFYGMVAKKLEMKEPTGLDELVKEIKTFEGQYQESFRSKEIKDDSSQIKEFEQQKITKIPDLLKQFAEVIDRLETEKKLMGLIRNVSKTDSFNNPFQDRVAGWRISKTREHVELIEQREWELEAKTPTAYVAYVFTCVTGLLAKGDEYSTVTNFRFWSSRAVGDSAFLVKNVEAVARGADVKRVFLIDKKQWKPGSRERLVKVLQGHEKACSEANAAGKGKMEVRCLLSENFNRDYKFYGHFGLARHRGGRKPKDLGAMVIVPRYTSTLPGSTITHLKLIFSNGPSIATNTVEYGLKFANAWENSIDLSEILKDH